MSELTPEQRNAYYRWEFPKWHATDFPTTCCKGAVSVHTNRRAVWVCSNCGRDVGLETVLMYEAFNDPVDGRRPNPLEFEVIGKSYKLETSVSPGGGYKAQPVTKPNDRNRKDLSPHPLPGHPGRRLRHRRGGDYLVIHEVRPAHGAPGARAHAGQAQLPVTKCPLCLKGAARGARRTYGKGTLMPCTA